MKQIILGVLLLLGLALPAAADPVVGQSVLYRYDSTHVYAGLVTGVDSTTEADLMLFAGGTSSLWLGTYTGEGTPSVYVFDVAIGSGNGQWLANPAMPVPSPSRVSAQSTPTLTLNGSAVQFSTIKDTIYTVSVKISTVLSLTGGSAGHVDLVCDATTTPTVIVGTVSSESTGSLTIGLNLVASNTLTMSWRVPVGHRCKLPTTNDTGTPTFTLVRQLLQILD